MWDKKQDLSHVEVLESCFFLPFFFYMLPTNLFSSLGLNYLSSGMCNVLICFKHLWCSWNCNPFTTQKPLFFFFCHRLGSFADKNKFKGAEKGAFKLLLEAWSLLADKVKRISYDQRWKSKEEQKPPTPYKPASSNGNRNASQGVDPRACATSNKPADAYTTCSTPISWCNQTINICFYYKLKFSFTKFPFFLSI